MINRNVFKFVSIFALIGIRFVSGCISQENPEVERELLESVATVSIIVHNHWNDNDINDGKIVYIPLINKRNEILGRTHKAYIKNLTTTIIIKGLDNSYNNYSVILFNRTYQNVNYLDIDFPDDMNKGFIIYFNELKEYNQECCIAIFAKVMLPNGRVLKTHEPYHFSIEPLTSME